MSRSSLKIRITGAVAFLFVATLLSTAVFAQEIGGGSSRLSDPERDGGPSRIGQRLTAGGLSLLLPGAGQWYNGQMGKAKVFGMAEAAVWVSWLVFDNQVDGYTEDYEDYAGIYAGTSGSHSDNYWRTVGRYMSSEEYNLGVQIEARATGEEPRLISEADSWSWRNSTFQENYQELRADTNRAKERRDFMILFAIINRAVAAYDAMRNIEGREHLLEVAGFGFDLQQRSRYGVRESVCVFSRGF